MTCLLSSVSESPHDTYTFISLVTWPCLDATDVSVPSEHGDSIREKREGVDVGTGNQHPLL